MDKNDTYRIIVDELKNYGRLKLDYVKLVCIEKLSTLLAAMAVACIITVLAMVALFFLTEAFQNVLAAYIGDIWSYVIVASLFIVIGIIVFVFKKQLILNPVCRLVSKIFIDKN